MRRELLLLHEMRGAATAIRGLIGERTAAELEDDAVRRAAVLWHFTVLGEAASQVPSEVKARYGDVEWTAATRLRNRIVHGYWSIDLALLVDTANEDLPAVVAGLDLALNLEERSP